MPRKTLISFLGNSKYKECVYQNESQGFKSPVVRFVQEAVVQMHCQKWTKKDRIFIFLTEEAKTNQWEGAAYGSPNMGLKAKLEKLNINAEIIPIDNIPKGFSEEEIWGIFELFYSKIEKEDEVYFDITHGFRSLPMLGMVLMNYAKALKNIEVKSITYGAFEALGAGYDIEERIPNPKDRIAPLLDLIGLNELQDWAIAADNFVKAGDSSKIIALTKERITPILKSTKEASIPAETLNSLSNSLELLSGNMATNRGRAIVEGKTVENIKSSLLKIKQNPKIIPALRPVLNEISHKLSTFNSSTPNWLAAVEWCIEHNLIQQGITQLQEGILTQLCEKSGEGLLFRLDYTKEVHRSLPKQAMNIIKKKMGNSPEKWYWPASKNIETVKKLLEDRWVIALEKPFNALSDLRNDINHGGYLSEKTPNKFKSELKTKFELIKVILEIK